MRETKYASIVGLESEATSICEMRNENEEKKNQNNDRPKLTATDCYLFRFIPSLTRFLAKCDAFYVHTTVCVCVCVCERKMERKIEFVDVSVRLTLYLLGNGCECVCVRMLF